MPDARPQPAPYRLSALGMLALSLGLLGGGVWVYVALLQTSLGALPWGGAREVGRWDAPPRVALLRSDYTADLRTVRGDAGPDAGWYDATRNDWRAFLLNRGIPFGEIADADLEAGALDGYATLVLPAAQALSDAQLARVAAFLEDGGGVLATWTPGVYHPNGTWRGYAFLDEIVGARYAGTVPRGGSGYHTARDTFPGAAEAGLYLPRQALPASAYTPAQADANARRRAAPFAPLDGYAWAGPPDAARPAASFALAEPLPGAGATAVTYHTWRGGDPTAADALAAAFRRFTLRGGTPLTAGLPAGTQLRAGSFDAPVMVRPADARTQVAGSWYDYASDGRLPAEARAASAGLLYGRYGAGRVVFLGHELAALGVGADDQRVLARLVDNAFGWLARRPRGWVADWPAPYRSAAVLAAHAGSDPSDGDAALAGLDTLHARLAPRGLPATYFVGADFAKAHAALYRRLDAHGEVAVALPPDAPASGGDAPGALRRERARLAETVPLPVGARLSHGEAVDPYRALARAGFAYVATDSVADRAVPTLLRPAPSAGGAPLVRLHRTARRPAETLRRLPDARLQAQYAREDAERLLDAGGLVMPTFDGADLASGRALPMLDATVEALASDGAVWFATAADVAAWWRARSRLTLDVRPTGPRRVTVRLANDGPAAVRDVGVGVALGRPAQGVRVTPELVGTPAPRATLAGDGETVRLVVEALAPGASQTFHLDVEPSALLAERVGAEERDPRRAP